MTAPAATSATDPAAPGASQALPRRQGLGLVLALGLLGFGAASCAGATGAGPGAPTPAAGAAAVPATAAVNGIEKVGGIDGIDRIEGITEIVLEQGCFGCASGSVLALRRDGSAVRTVTGNARHGTADSRSRATIASAEFDALARAAVTQGFYGWRDTYQDPQVQDGDWTVLRLSRGGESRQVFQRHGAGPPALAALVQAIDAWQARTPFEAVR